jgi:D-alanine-D-alanine ligase
MQHLHDYLPTALAYLKHRASIAVIYAGDPEDPQNVQFRSHNPRSWKSYRVVAQDICDALLRLGFERVQLFAEGRTLATQLEQRSIDFAWLNTAGVQGLDSSGHCAGLLESLGIPYVGHTPANMALMDNKQLFKMHLQNQQIATAPYISWHPRESAKITQSAGFIPFLAGLGNNPRFVVKPVCGRASLNVHVAESTAQLDDLCRQVYQHTGNSVLVEHFLPGAEYCVAVMGDINSRMTEADGWHFNGSGAPFCFAQFERQLSAPDAIFTSMDICPISADSIKRLDSHANARVIEALNRIAAKIYRGLGLHSIVRVDLRMDHHGELHVLEANPKPDLKSPADDATSLVSLGLEQLGIDYDVMIINQLSNTLAHLYHYRQTMAARLAGQ